MYNSDELRSMRPRAEASFKWSRAGRFFCMAFSKRQNMGTESGSVAAKNGEGDYGSSTEEPWGDRAVPYRERSGHTTPCQGGLCSRRSPLTHKQSTVDSVSHLCSCQLSTKQIGSSEKATPARDIRLYEHHSASILEHSRWRFLQVHSSPSGRDRVTVNTVILLSFMCQKAEMPPL